MEKIAYLSYKEKTSLIARLGAFPAHKIKLMSVFVAIKDVLFYLTY